MKDIHPAIEYFDISLSNTSPSWFYGEGQDDSDCTDVSNDIESCNSADEMLDSLKVYCSGNVPSANRRSKFLKNLDFTRSKMQPSYSIESWIRTGEWPNCSDDTVPIECNQNSSEVYCDPSEGPSRSASKTPNNMQATISVNSDNNQIINLVDGKSDTMINDQHGNVFVSIVTDKESKCDKLLKKYSGKVNGNLVQKERHETEDYLEDEILVRIETSAASDEDVEVQINVTEFYSTPTEPSKKTFTNARSPLKIITCPKTDTYADIDVKFESDFEEKSDDEEAIETQPDFHNERMSELLHLKHNHYKIQSAMLVEEIMEDIEEELDEIIQEINLTHEDESPKSISLSKFKIGRESDEEDMCPLESTFEIQPQKEVMVCATKSPPAYPNQVFKSISRSKPSGIDFFHNYLPHLDMPEPVEDCSEITTKTDETTKESGQLSLIISAEEVESDESEETLAKIPEEVPLSNTNVKLGSVMKNYSKPSGKDFYYNYLPQLDALEGSEALSNVINEVTDEFEDETSEDSDLGTSSTNSIYEALVVTSEDGVLSAAFNEECHNDITPLHSPMQFSPSGSSRKSRIKFEDEGEDDLDDEASIKAVSENILSAAKDLDIPVKYVLRSKSSSKDFYIDYLPELDLAEDEVDFKEILLKESQILHDEKVRSLSGEPRESLSLFQHNKTFLPSSDDSAHGDCSSKGIYQSEADTFRARKPIPALKWYERLHMNSRLDSCARHFSCISRSENDILPVETEKVEPFKCFVFFLNIKTCEVDECLSPYRSSKWLWWAIKHSKQPNAGFTASEIAKYVKSQTIFRGIKDRRVFCIEKKLGVKIAVEEKEMYTVKGNPCFMGSIIAYKELEIVAALGELEHYIPQFSEHVIFFDRLQELLSFSWPVHMRMCLRRWNKAVMFNVVGYRQRRLFEESSYFK